jgi:hypothetical protein
MVRTLKIYRQNMKFFSSSSKVIQLSLLQLILIMRIVIIPFIFKRRLFNYYGIFNVFTITEFLYGAECSKICTAC